MKIICDVDGVLVDTPRYWFEWLGRVCGVDVKLTEHEYNYNLTTYFKWQLEDAGVDGFSYWRSQSLYDDLTPINGSVEVLKEFYNKGWYINFVSKIKGNHSKTKAYWLKRHFPFYNAILWTHEKGEVKGDIVIDDRLDNLYQFDNRVVKILYKTPYKQTVENRGDVLIANDWQDVRQYLQELYEKDESRKARLAHGIVS